jgi:Cd2+/Zn2+-exporting ATPase
MPDHAPDHIHTYDAQGNKTCCSLEEKYAHEDKRHDHAGHDHAAHDDDHDHTSTRLQYVLVVCSLLMLGAGLLAEHVLMLSFFTSNTRLVWYLLAYLPVCWPVMQEARESILNKKIFTEFSLMILATGGAFAIGEYPEALAVILFYTIGELVQTAAVNRSKRSIAALLDTRPDTVSVLRNGKIETIPAQQAAIDDIIQAKPGEKIGLDGELVSDNGSFNTSALTGESRPDTKGSGDPVYAGMINLLSVVDIRVTALYKDSKLSGILQMVQEATARKSRTQQFISRFAEIYTPIVVLLAFLLCVLPYFFVDDYIFRDWLYRSLVFLVISCPCALLISIPLGYFGGIGAGSRHGILFKGSVFLDIIASVQAVVMDKTGTLTHGVFEVQQVIPVNTAENELMAYTAALESKSTHPAAQAIVRYVNDKGIPATVSGVEEIPGHGLKGIVNGHEVLAGNALLMDKFSILYDPEVLSIPSTVVMVAIDQCYAGCFVIADKIKEDAGALITKLKDARIRTIMLSGDKQSVVSAVAKQLEIDEAFGNLLPEGKVRKLEELKSQNLKIAFAGDGINDAPVIALADAGIAMGGLGSDAAIETADIVIRNDRPSSIYTAIQIGRQTKRIVWQNVGLAFGVKVIVLLLGAGGLATMWEAVFADVGVALLAILNAVRIQKMDFNG